jgi:hypothetical protein
MQRGGTDPTVMAGLDPAIYPQPVRTAPPVDAAQFVRGWPGQARP